MSKSANYGIQGTRITIKADALAVGEGARASSRSSAQTGGDIVSVLKEIGDAIDGLRASDVVHAELRAELEALKKAVVPQAQAPDQAKSLITGLVGKLSAAGVAISQLANVIEPIRKLATLLGISIKGLG